MTSDAPKKRLSLEEQAEYIETLALRCYSHTDKSFGPTLLSLDQGDVEVLRQLAERLKRMAPHEHEIRRTVVGR